MQDFVGLAEGFHHRDILVAHLQQAIVGDHDEGVADITQIVDAFKCLLGTTRAFEGEGAGNDANGQGAEFLGKLSDDGSSAGTGATTFTSGNEDHVCSLQGGFDFVAVVFSALASNFGVGTSAEATSCFTADVQLHIRVSKHERLGVGVDGDEFNSLEAVFDHAVNGVYAATADTNNFDDGKVSIGGRH